MSLYSQSTNTYRDALAALGMAGNSLMAQMNETVTQQGYMMATNDFFRVSCVAFALLAVLVWTTKPRRGAGASMSH